MEELKQTTQLTQAGHRIHIYLEVVDDFLLRLMTIYSKIL